MEILKINIKNHSLKIQFSLKFLAFLVVVIYKIESNIFTIFILRLIDSLIILEQILQGISI